MARGQMVRPFDQSLCERASSVRCHQCFPEFTPEHFSLRRMWIKHHLDMVDVYVAPTEFLRQRYIEWGIAPEKIVHIPNGHRPPRTVGAGSSAAPTRQRRNRFGFFGQLVDNKGLLVLFEAIKLLRNRGQRDFTVDVYGSNLNFASDSFRAAFDAFWESEKEASKDGEQRVRFKGSYDHDDLPRLMAGIDWVLVPSSWWEIFGMVVSEAFLYGKPVICSDIGGIAERVRDNVDGLHFTVRNSESLADTMARAMDERDLWDRLHANVQPPPTARAVAAMHVAGCYQTHVPLAAVGGHR
jgi:glycosyltransferase involved in cell wall biosynthesis